MATKTPKKQTDFDKVHLRNIERIRKRIDKIFVLAAEEAAQIGTTIKTALPEDKIFSFADYPKTKRSIDRLLASMSKSLNAEVENGIEVAWRLSDEKNDSLVYRVFADDKGEISPEVKRRYLTSNEGALKAFLERKTDGLSLSDNVWRYTNGFKDEIELALDCGIRDGLSAGEMSRAVRQYLKYPDKLFRRVRDEHGNLKLSQAAAAFHPGRGVYRSSYKNALRLAATEVNIAYRTADYLRWQSLDFVVGMRITLSNNHTLNGKAFTDICDDLSAPLGSTNTSGRGCYPKDFKFTGWHPFCRCFAVSILKTDKEMAEDNKRIMAGKEPSKTSVNSVTDVPKEFATWIEDNKERILAADVRGTLPYFIKDNGTAVSRLIDSPLKSIGVSKVVGTIAGNQIVTELSTLAKSLGIDIGEPMTFEEANEMRGNPHFAKDKAYRVNCQTCVVANEMRRRGLNVEALPNTKGSALGRLSKRTERAWLDANGNIPISNVVGAQMSPIKWEGEEYYVTYGGRCKNRKQLVSAFESSVTEDGRYHVKWSWKGKAGHIITAERIDGKYRYYDPQNGRIITDFVKYIDNIKLSSGIQWLRVDNLRINPEVAKEVLTRAGAKARIGGVSASGGTAGKLREISQEECNYKLPNGGSVSTSADRLQRGNSGKQEFLKLEKELRMARRYAEAGHRVELLKEVSGISSPDALIDGLKVDFKSLNSANNIERHAKDAIYRQGADEVWFEFTIKTDKIISTIKNLTKKGIHGRYYFLGENKEYHF